MIDFPGGNFRGPERTPSPERDFRDPDEKLPAKKEGSSLPDQEGGNIQFECEDLAAGVNLESSDRDVECEQGKEEGEGGEEGDVREEGGMEGRVGGETSRKRPRAAEGREQE